MPIGEDPSYRRGNWGDWTPPLYWSPAEASPYKGLLDGPLYLHHGNVETRPFSTAVVGLSYVEAERHGKTLPGYRDGELFFVSPEFDPSQYVWFRFDKVYIVAELMPEMRTEDEEEWFAKFERQLNPGAKVIYFAD